MFAAVAAAALVASSCTSDDGGSAVPPLVTSSLAVSVVEDSSAVSLFDIAAEVRQVECPGDLANADVACGLAIVPLDRRNIDLGTMEVSFATAAGTGPVARPMAVLQGGPGGASTDLARWFPSRSFPQVFVDQRGTGFAPTDFDCPEFDSSVQQSAGEEAAEAVATLNAGLRECAARLADDVVLDHTTTANHANDVEAIMAGLGYTEWTAYGVSYGSTIGFELLAAARGGLAGVVLDGVYPPDIDIEAGFAFSAQRSLDALADACAQSPRCAGFNVDVTASIERLLERFAAAPVTVSVDDTDVVIDDVRLAEYVFLLSYSEQQMRYLPAALAGIEQDDDDALRWLARTGTSTLVSAYGANDEATYYAVTCHDRLPFIDGERQDLSPYQAALTSTPIAASCGIWDRGSAPAAAGTPVESDLPVLLLSGQFDPITPSVFADDAASRLSNATLVTQDGRGHGIWVGDACIASIVAAFVAEPGRDLDTSCADVGVPIQWAQP